ncbi:MAG: hypothetical protein EA419_08915 [Wenzhouxiangella sp.]|nr:MAG: hypothetical protein EA419_08915 [Wenzhouxiangella sp.]
MFLSAIFTAFLLTACGGPGGDDPDAEQGVAARITTTANTGSTPGLPEYFPESIPLPDEYIVLRNDSRQSETHGTEIGLNVALPGSIDEWLQTYGEALEQNFEDVELTEDPSSRSWRFSFHGQGFEVGNLYLNRNRGYLDRGDIDSSHLPVILTLSLTEKR